ETCFTSLEDPTMNCLTHGAALSALPRARWSAIPRTLLAILALSVVPNLSAAEDWPMFGQNPENTAAIGGNSGKDVHLLKPKWTFTAGGDVSARAAVARGLAFFPDWAGNIWAVKTNDG